MHKLSLIVLALIVILSLAGCDLSKRAPSKEAVDLNNQAVRSLTQGDCDRAYSLVNDAIKLEPEFSAAFANKAAILEKQGKLAEAAETLNALIKSEPDYAEAYIPLGVLQEKMGRMAEAENHYAKALELFTAKVKRAKPEQRPALQLTMAVAQFLLKDTKGALTTLESLLTSNPGNEAARAYKQRMETGRREVFLNGPAESEQANQTAK